MNLSPAITNNYFRNAKGMSGLALFSSGVQRAANRFLASRLWRKVGEVYRKLVGVFTLHPAQTHETYLQHLWFTMRMSLRFAALGVILLTHGIFPFVFTRTASLEIEKVYLIMRSRIPKTRRDAIESEYEI